MNSRIKTTIIILVVGIAFMAGTFVSVKPQAMIADVLRLDDQEATIRAIKKNTPSVVSISVNSEQTRQSIDLSTGTVINENIPASQAFGTGFLISPDGLIMTNKHVVEAINGTSTFKITLTDGRNFDAKLIGKDPLNDLAFLKINAKNLPAAEMGDSSKLPAGSTVIAIGNVLGIYQNSVTKGIISGLNRNISASDQSGMVENLGNVLQTDAQINPGNSGGPLVDLNGRVVGVNVAIDTTGQAISFAIPINDAKPLIKVVRETGRVIRPRLGIRYVMLTPEIAAANKLSRSSGAWINAGSDKFAITPDSPAVKADIRPGDIIIETNGMAVNMQNPLLSAISNFRPGQKINLKIVRGNQTLVRSVVLDEFN
jgi:serine protease Do